MPNLYPLLRIFKKTLLVAGFFTFSKASAQKANIWYFGHNAGMDFSSGAPVPLLNSAMMTYEASGSICDANGALLFYTNGGTAPSGGIYTVGAVWNRTHAIMQNGNMATAGGCTSAKQGTLIVQDPADATEYYIFTTDCSEHDMEGGLRYTKVDMTANVGLGAVTSLGAPVFDGVTESMIGIRHANGVDVWVLVHGNMNSDFHAFLVTANGITGPVTTTIGPVITNQPGDMVVNSNSTKVHCAGSNTSSLYDFDPNTGVLSNFVDLIHDAFGCAFSRSGNYLYTCEALAFRRVFQYDMLAADIAASVQEIGDGIGFQTALQLAPDGRIYMSRVGMFHLGVINEPELPGMAADFVEEGFHLGGRRCQAGLPTFVNDLVLPGSVGIAERPVVPSLQCLVNADGLWIRSGTDMAKGRYAIFRSDGALVREGRLLGGGDPVPIDGFTAGLYVVRLLDHAGRSGAASFVIADAQR